MGGEGPSGAGPRGAEGGLMATTASPDWYEVHHCVPRCLLKAWDRGHGPGLEPEDLAAWFEWEEEANR